MVWFEFNWPIFLLMAAISFLALVWFLFFNDSKRQLIKEKEPSGRNDSISVTNNKRGKQLREHE